jgi:SAM-dependent methyltransferase
MPAHVYDQIGVTYASTRRADPRITAAIHRAIGDARRVINVGAGTGAYEPSDRFVYAVEPSLRMIAQRPRGAAPVVRASAEALPFHSDAFDAALALLTLHHWTDWRRGLDEMKRVARRCVLFTFEPNLTSKFWLTEHYFPEVVELDRARCPSVQELAQHLGNARIEHIPVPHDCQDGFLAAFWRRPEAYLDATVRAGMSGLARLDESVVARGIERLRADLASGAWEARFGHLRSLETLDVCYRLVMADR